MADRITIRGLRCFGHHGVEAVEREAGQEFLVDVECSLDLSEAAASDSISDTIDYSELISQVREIVESESHLLLERLARRVIEAMLEHSRIDEVTVAISKPGVAEQLGLAEVEVALTGSRE
jgi:dihydroneopterin aldolase